VAAIAVSADGDHIFLALEDTSGFPVIITCERASLGTFTAAYNPGAGSAANVASVPGNPDLMLFYGNFGSGVQVISHVISTGVNTNISPAGLTTKICNTLAVNPSDSDEIIITINTDQDLLRTIDGGANWSSLYAVLGVDPTGLAVRWDDPDRVYVAGYDGADVDLLYSPNEGDYFTDVSGAALKAAAGVVGVETT